MRVIISDNFFFQINYLLNKLFKKGLQFSSDFSGFLRIYDLSRKYPNHFRIRVGKKFINLCFCQRQPWQRHENLKKMECSSIPFLARFSFGEIVCNSGGCKNFYEFSRESKEGMLADFLANTSRIIESSAVSLCSQVHVIAHLL